MDRSGASLEHHNAWRRPGFLLWHASLRWQRTMTATLRPLGLTHAQFMFLGSIWYLERRGGAPSQRQLAEHTASDAMMTSQVVRTLEAHDLARRWADPDDRRVQRLGLTAEGCDLAERAVRAVEVAEERYFSTAADRGALIDGLAILAGRPTGEGP